MENTSTPVSASCIFCRIVSGEIPATKIYEDGNFLAFLDIHPQSPGHAQVISKKHVRWVWDVENVGEYFEVVRKIAKAQQKAFGTDWILSKIIGDEVPHAHIWVFPSDEAKGDKNDLAANAEKIRENLG
ncbi:MAG: HIT domain-containing protein [Patescibacteria group bacterium]